MNDILALNRFYASPLGQVTRRLVGRALRRHWQSVRGGVVLGVGHAAPHLGPFRGEAERVLAMMPAPQGVSAWPQRQGNLAALTEETALPLPDCSVDHLLLIHGLDTSEQVRPVLREVWRVLADSGRLLVVVPNRRGLWAHFDHTPFGTGRPFSAGQARALLRANMFEPGPATGALYVPPVQSRLGLASAHAWEQVGTRVFPTLGGVLLVPAVKQTVLASRHLRRERARVPLPWAEGVRGLQRREALDSPRASITLRPWNTIPLT